MLTRKLYAPVPNVSRYTTPVPVLNGGTGAATDVQAVHNLGGIHLTDASIANGYAPLGADGKLAASLFPDEAQGGPTLIGPTSLLTQAKGIWTITNYDSQEAYTVTCDQGFVTRSGDKIYYTAPTLEGTYGFTLNNKIIQVAISAHYVNQPSILTPANTVAAISNVVLTDTLYASDRVSNDLFGIAIDLTADGSRLVVGARSKTVNGVTAAGQVYVYTRSGTSWVLESTISAGDKAASDFFGSSVSITADGSRVAVGAYNKTISALTQAGQVYIYSRSGNNWVLESTLTASDKATSDAYGQAVSISADGSRLAVGAVYKDVSSIVDAGQVYIYTRSGTVWTEEQKLSASDKVTGDNFGGWCSLSANGDKAAISSHGRDSGGLANSGAVYIFTRSGTVWTQEQILTASDKVTGDGFGLGVTFDSSGTRLAIAATGRTINNITNPGRIYILVKNGSIWTEEYIFNNTDNTYNEYLGIGIAFKGDGLQLVASAHVADSPDVLNCGAVMTFTLEYNTTSKVTQPATVTFTSSPFALTGQYLESVLTASDAELNADYGVAVAVSADGTRMAVGSHTKTAGGVSQAGQVYVYTRSGSTWIEESKLSASDKAAGDFFGIGVALSSDGSRLAIGANSKTVNGVTAAGQVYIYTRSGSVWTLETILSAADKATTDAYGSGVSLSATGDRLVIGAYSKNVSAVSQAGKVYVYTRAGSVWTEEAQITASDKAASDFFGRSVSLAADSSRLAVGSYFRDSGGTVDSGAVYIYTRSGTVWTQEQILVASDKAANDYFGIGVAFTSDASRLTVGARGKTVNGVVGAGKVYNFIRSGSVWTEDTQLVAVNPAVNDWFGTGVSLVSDGSRLIVGDFSTDASPDQYNTGQVNTYLMSYHEGTDWQLATDPGFVNIVQSVTNNSVNRTSWQVTDLLPGTDYYVRCRHKGTTYGYGEWSPVTKLTTKTLFLPTNEQQILTASDKVAGDQFGVSVALSSDGSRMAVGANFKTVGGITNCGQVYIYTRSGTTWTLESTLTASDKAASDLYGVSVALSADSSRLAVGAHSTTVSGIATAGKVYVYTRSGSVWTQEAIVSASDKAAGDHFGVSVAFDSTASRMAVGAHTKTVSAITGAGQVYVYTRSGSNWTEEQKISASDKAASDGFGVTLAIDAVGQRLAVGATNKTTGGFTGAGKVYLYTRSGVTWTEETTLTAADKAANDAFGAGISFNSLGTELIVGAYGKTVGGIAGAGQVYIFSRNGITWTQETILSASDKAANDAFGFKTALTANSSILAVGSYNRDSSGLANSGAVYIYS